MAKKPPKAPKPPKAAKDPTAGTKSSLVARLNSRLMVRLTGIYIGMDLLLVLLFGVCVLFSAYWRVEGVAALVEERGIPSAEATLWMEAGDYSAAALDRPPQGTPLPVTVGEGLASQALYSFHKGEHSWLFGSWVGSPGADCTLTAELTDRAGAPYAVTLDLSGSISAAVYAARVLLVCQIISLILNLFKNAGVIKKVLRPIQDLTRQTARLNRAMSPEELRSLAGQLDEITATHLDARIPEDGAQRELKDLTQSINAMLDRVDRAYHAQARFVSDASHELRTPIAVIQGYANLLNRWGKDDPAARQEAIDAIIAEGEAMKNLVEQLLFLARGDNHTMKVKPERLDATEVAAQVLKETALVDQTHPLSADWDGSVFLAADPDLLKEALRILVDNAVKYTPEGGRITLKIRRAGESARLEVMDEGVGVAGEDLPHVFERFYRADASRARQTGGSGLGLSIAEHIARCHNGHLEVTSAPGIGSKFTLVLPLAA